MVLPIPRSDERAGRRALELGRVLESARADDAARALHQAGHRVLGADAARVGERDGVALVVGHRELVVAGATRRRLRRRPGTRAKPMVSVRLMPGTTRLRVPSGFGQVDRDAEVDVRRGDDGRLAVDLVVEDVLARELLERLDDRPGDEVGERHLAAAGALEVVVDDDAVVDHQLGRDGANARRGRNREADVHVGGEALRRRP